MQPVLWARGTPGASEGLTIGIQWLTSVESLLCASPALTQRVPNILSSWRPWCLSNSPQRSLAKRNAEQVDSSHPPLWPLQANPGASPFRVDGVGLAKTSRGGRGGLPGGRTAQWAGRPSPSAGVQGSDISGQAGTHPGRSPYPHSLTLPSRDNTKPLYFSFSIKSRAS